MTQYERYAQDIAGLIHNGSLRVGDRLPSVRVASRNRRISASTVFEAYYLLESQGLIQARPRSGYYVSARALPELRAPEPAAPARQAVDVEINDLVLEILNLARREAVVPLGSAFPDPALFPLARLARSLASSMRRLQPQHLLQDLSAGHARLRQQIAQRYAQDGLTIGVEELVVTNGAMEALNLCLQAVTEPGDLVAIETPTFYAALQALERLKLRPLEIATDPVQGMDPAALAAVLAEHPVKACWLMSSFQNPMGHSMPEGRKRAVAELLARHRVPLIEDDVYGELYFGARKPLPVKAFDRQGLVLHCASFSKCLAPGYRVGWAAAGAYTRTVERLKLMSSLSASVPSQLALSDYLGQGGYDLHLRRLRQTLERQRDVMLEALVQTFPAGTRMTQPEGGCFIWVELPEGMDALQLLRQALDQGVSLMPGQLFSADRRFSRFVRLNYAAAPAPAVREATRVLGRLVGDGPLLSI